MHIVTKAVSALRPIALQPNHAEDRCSMLASCAQLALLLLALCWLPPRWAALAIVVPVGRRGREEDTPYGRILGEWLSGMGTVDDLEEALMEIPIEQEEDLPAAADFLARCRDPKTPVRALRRLHRGLPRVVDSCLAVREPGLCRNVYEHVLPEAVLLFEDSLGRRSRLSQQTALVLLELLLAFDEPEAAKRVIRAVRRPLLPEHLDWSHVFSQLDGEHPFWPEIRDALTNPLPPGFIAVAFLDAMNDLAMDGDLDSHPFTSEEGCERLQGWLTSRRPEDTSRAHSATTALPFLGRQQREALLPLARRHPDEAVQMEASWAAAVTGDETGVADLSRWATDALWSRQACLYLRELRREESIPAKAQEPDFEAIAALTAWLAHDDQFGIPPDRISVFDRRELFWPPSGGRRLVHLLRYAVHVGDEEFAGIGFVGDLSFALMEHATERMSVEDLYGLYCAWELIYNGHPEAPAGITALTGRAILARHNPDFPARD